MMKAIPLYEFFIPATMQIYFTEIVSLVDFEMLTPDGLAYAFTNSTVEELITGVQAKIAT